MDTSSFKPAWWLANSHLQTILADLMPRRSFKSLPLERERIELPDGDFIDLDWVERKKTGPLVIILHGFEGSINSHYARGMLHQIKQHGWRGVFMHFRGCSGEPNRLPRGYHAGETEDLAYIINLLRQRESQTTMSAIGYSLGGNVLLKWLGETGQTNPLSAAVSISVPFELQIAAKQIQSGFSQFYQWYFLWQLRKRLARKFRLVPADMQPETVFRAKTLHEFDHVYTAPLHGFNSAEHYYLQSSSRQFLRHIHVPTLIVHAIDDPLVTTDGLPKPQDLSPMVKFELTQGGGHVGFITGKYPWRPEYWLEQRIPEFLHTHV